jgi:hypothetical protein
MIMLVAVGVRMIVRMNLIAMRVLVGVSVPMLVLMRMRVFMRAFHFLYPFLSERLTYGLPCTRLCRLAIIVKEVLHKNVFVTFYAYIQIISVCPADKRVLHVFPGKQLSAGHTYDIELHVICCSCRGSYHG